MIRINKSLFLSLFVLLLMGCSSLNSYHVASKTSGPQEFTPSVEIKNVTSLPTLQPQGLLSSPITNSSSVPIHSETATSISTEDVFPPFDSTLRGDTGCGAFSAKLLLNKGQSLSQDALANQLMETYLLHFKSPDMYGFCRIIDFKIESVSFDQRIAFLASEQNVDFVVGVVYSVQIPADPSMWEAGNGENSPHGWILRKYNIIGVLSSDAQYVLKILGTGP